jgi:hypothetical protein
VTVSTGYTHHGIDCSDGSVIHYSGELGKKTEASTRRTSFAEGMVVAAAPAAMAAIVQYGSYLIYKRLERRSQRWGVPVAHPPVAERFAAFLELSTLHASDLCWSERRVWVCPQFR